MLSGHVPPIVKDLNLQPVGRLAATNVLHLVIGLPLQNQAALGVLLQQLYDPASPNYRHYLTPAQFAQRFGPAPADYQALTGFAKANGLRITGTHPNRVILEVDGSVADIERALQVTLREYQHPQEARTFYAPDAEPSLDLAVPVLHIAGLDNFSLPHPNLRVGPATPAARVIPQAGSEGGEYIGNDFRAAYVPGSPLTGTGQSVALLEYDGYYASDITHYETLAKLPAVTLTNIPINGGPVTPGPGDGEVSLDIEMAISMATNLTQILVYEGTNGVTSWATILNQIANDDLANQVSCSWSGGAADPSASQVFEQMAAQGQSFFNAAGDSRCVYRRHPVSKRRHQHHHRRRNNLVDNQPQWELRLGDGLELVCRIWYGLLFLPVLPVPELPGPDGQQWRSQHLLFDPAVATGYQHDRQSRFERHA